MRICVYKKQNDKKAVSNPISSSRIQPHARACCNTGRGMPERGVGGLVVKGPQRKRKKYGVERLKVDDVVEHVVCAVGPP